MLGLGWWLGLDLPFVVLWCVWSCLLKIPRSYSGMLWESITRGADAFLPCQYLVSKERAHEHIKEQALVQHLFGAL